MATFIEKLSNLLDIKDDEANELITKASISQLIGLTSSITNNDKEKAENIYKTIIGEDNFFIGEPVSFNDSKAIVTKPDVTGNMIEITQKGEKEVVHKDEVDKLEENFVFGLNSIPGIDRLKVLAGIKPQGPVGAGETNDPSNPDNTENKQINNQEQTNHNQPTGNTDTDMVDDESNNKVKETVQYISLDVEEPDAADVCLAALDELEDNLDNITIADLAEIRRRLLALVNHLNENISYTGRKKKI